MKLASLLALALPSLAAAHHIKDKPAHYCDPATGHSDIDGQGSCDAYLHTHTMQPRFINGKWVCLLEDSTYPLELCSPGGIPKGYNDKGEKVEPDRMHVPPLPPGIVDGHGPPGCVYQKDANGEWECVDPHP